MLAIGAADGPDGVLPRERTWTVTFLGLEPRAGRRSPGRPASRCAPRSAPTRARARPHRADALFAMLNAAQYGHEAKEAAWRTLTSELAPAAMLAELHAQALPRELIGALSELLTAR